MEHRTILLHAVVQGNYLGSVACLIVTIDHRSLGWAWLAGSIWLAWLCWLMIDGGNGASILTNIQLPTWGGIWSRPISGRPDVSTPVSP